MSNKIAEIAQAPGTKRLALAILVSIIFHVYLVGGLDLRLPSQKKAMHTIEAVIQMPKAVSVAQVVKEQTEAVAVSPQSPQESPVETIETPVNVAALEPETANTEAVRTETAPAIPSSIQTQSAEQDLQQEPQPVDMGLVVNENAYRYVETDFYVTTTIDGAPEGSAKIVYSLVENQQYQLTCLMKPEGLAALITSDLLQISQGTLTKNGLQPNSYAYQYSGHADKTYSSKFDWAKKTVSLVTDKGTETKSIADGTQDALSFMYQFMYVPPLPQMPISIVTGERLTHDDYSAEALGSMSIPLGEIKMIYVYHAGVGMREKTEIWLAADYQYVPVKIRKTDNNGKVYEMVAKRISTARPVLPE